MKTCPQCGKIYDDKLIACPVDNTPLTQVASTNSDPMLGQILAGRYRIVEKIGEGGMGAIYKAVHTMMDRVCAIKLLTALSSGDQAAVVRFNREARMASRIDNPHAVTIYDFGEAQGGLLYLAMEFIDGKPLTQILAQHSTLPLDRVVRITSQIAEALAAAHSLGIVHRDLKPDNIMITRKAGDEDYVKVLDFGIAKAVADDSGDNLTKTGYVLGTPVYMSPEQLSGEKLDARSDVYSLAIIVYEMLSGRLPFEGDNPQSIMIKRVTGEPIRLRAAAPSVSDSVERVIMEGLMRERENRTPTVQAFASALDSAQYSGTQVLSSRTTSPIPDHRARHKTIEWASAHATKDSDPGYADIIPGGALSESASANQQAAENSPAGEQTDKAEPKSRIIERTPGRPPNEDTILIPPETRQERVVGVDDSRTVESEPQGLPWIKWAIPGVMLAAIMALVLYVLLPSRATGFTLVIEGAPPGSEVFVNDVHRGVTSADGRVSIEKLEAGEVNVRVSREGFTDFYASVNGQGGAAISVTAELLPTAIDYNGAMVLVQAGEFVMGDDGHEANEKPAHKVVLLAYYIDKFEVTNAQYKKFCDETRRPYPKPAWDEGYFINNPDSPVVCVSWDDAAAYARWAGKRLPREDEWEKAASWDPIAQRKRQWPWGDDARQASANINRSPEKPEFAPVGAYAGDVSAYNVHDMAGNAAEWIDSYYLPYEGNQTPDRDFGNKKYRVVRGGTCLSNDNQARTTYRQKHPWEASASEKTLWLVGLRCVVSADDPGLQQHLRARNK